MMDAPDPEGFSMLTKVVAAASFILVPAAGAWNWLDKRFARKHAVANDIQVITAEMALHRGYFKDVFQQMRDMEKVSEARHRELMMHIMSRGGK